MQFTNNDSLENRKPNRNIQVAREVCCKEEGIVIKRLISFLFYYSIRISFSCLYFLADEVLSLLINVLL